MTGVRQNHRRDLSQSNCWTTVPDTLRVHALCVCGGGVCVGVYLCVRETEIHTQSIDVSQCVNDCITEKEMEY